jgi:kynureninase
MELFDQATMEALRKKGDQLTSTFESLLRKKLQDKVDIVTPALPERGSMLCLKFHSNPKNWIHKLQDRDVHVDFREPDIIRATPAPLYNSFEDVFRFVKVLGEVIP